MDNKSDNTTTNTPKEEIRKPTPQERRSKILEILAKKSDIDRQGEVMRELKKFYKMEFCQSDISKDFKVLGIQKKKDGKGFDLSESGKRRHDTEELKKIARSCYFTSSDVCANFKTLIIKSKNIAYSHLLGNHLKMMYPKIIIDIICNECSVIVYYKDTPVFKSMSLEDDIIFHFPDPQISLEDTAH